MLLFFFLQHTFFSSLSLYPITNYAHTSGPVIDDGPNFVPYHLGHSDRFELCICPQQGQSDLFPVIEYSFWEEGTESFLVMLLQRYPNSLSGQ